MYHFHVDPCSIPYLRIKADFFQRSMKPYNLCDVPQKQKSPSIVMIIKILTVDICTNI